MFINDEYLYKILFQIRKNLYGDILDAVTSL